MLTLSLVTILVLALLLGGGVWIAFALLGTGWIALTFFGSFEPGPILASDFWGASYGWDLTALPMFVWMGEILFRSGLADNMFRALAPWLNRLPGRLLHSNIIGSGLFAAVCGSSAATCATVGKMTLPELERRGYDGNLAIGTLASASTLGLLIPPSIMMIVYGVVTEQSISRLFIAGILPGLLLLGLFMTYLIVWSLLVGARQGRAGQAESRMPMLSKIRNSAQLIPLLVLIGGILGSIYGGLASPTEAAAVGVVLSMLIARGNGHFNKTIFLDSLFAALRTACMIAFIIAGASFLSSALSFTQLPMQLANAITEMGLSPTMLLVVLTLFLLVLGCFLDGISLILLVTSIIMPLIEGAGIDLIWFGIYLVIVVEMSQITPPVGFNLFVIQGLTGKDIITITRATLPFFLLMILAVVLLHLFPEIVLYLPQAMN
ncbi:MULTISPECIES: TRAP transporter large permease [Chromohalobacter]|uniref:TRAP transporter large permease protein n=2 Tax=Chromohalobacter TaxID=42054 RepID=A0A9X3B315_9GAMM|nr:MULTISPECIES: TRAP transporter large permease subunit [Chromohalobacter]MCK0768541.1 TRAP transporter large permease subunit [Chromohalobacter canadensis]MCT8467490.1 TRAP transporter large permease subunit [Chromohalobacter canadensis]MCT8470762.1 TRAP transporter large permease subunit [Chromohalobacter canadensis]MCT8497987.1 TRAP transporter large permease subunit [Chromohalobacter canadensis]MCT8504329.1 TRAP transporter large permease subunit [Chromohalobacter moromii]